MALLIFLGGCATPSSTTVLQRDLTSLPSRVVLADVPFFPQQDYQCGPAALAMMLTYREVVVSADDLVKQIYLPERQGTLTPEIVAAVRQYDLVPYLLGTDIQDLLIEIAAGNPVLVMQNLGLSWYPLWHYSVVIGYDIHKQYFISRSGLDAERITTFRNFDNTWKHTGRWALVIPARDKLPATVNVLAWLQDAEELFATGHIMAAHRSFELASLKWPGNDAVWFALGNSFYHQKKPVDAEIAYRRALDIKQNNPGVWNNLAYALAEQGCQQHAIRAASCAMVQAPADTNIQKTLRDVSDSRIFVQKQPSQCNNQGDFCVAIEKDALPEAMNPGDPPDNTILHHQQ